MITVNERNYDFRSGMTLLDILKTDAVDIHGAVLVTLNGSLISKEKYNETLLNDGDAVLAIKVVSGG
ncbi:MAG: sulfur carrier protein ThiS [Oscillospiraceae bacterium]|nr:sulfur carrier protein ThiS [Oscillospiraceae bacterium]